MKLKKTRVNFFYFAVHAIFALVVFAAAAKAEGELTHFSIRSFNIDKNIYQAGDTVSINYMLQQNLDFPYTDLKSVIGVYRMTEGIETAVAEITKQNLDFASREVKSFTETWSIPKNILPGHYVMWLKVVDPADTLAGSAFKEFDVQNPSQGIGVQIGVIKFYQNEKGGFGIEGFNVNPNESFEIKFDLKNVGLQAIENVAWKINAAPAYQLNEMFAVCDGMTSIAAAETKEVGCTAKLSKPRSYTVYFTVSKDNESLAASTGRVVAKGVSGSIVFVKNAKDVYAKNDAANVDVKLIGPADAVSVVDEADLILTIEKEGKVVAIQTKKVTGLGDEYQLHSFSFTAPEDLNEYLLRIVLKKGTEVLDEFVAGYQKLVPEIVVTSDGRLRNLTVKGCFDDNVCDENERTLPNCFDCRPEVIGFLPALSPPALPVLTPSPSPSPTPTVKPPVLKLDLLIVFLVISAIAIVVALFFALKKLRERVLGGKGLGGAGTSTIVFAVLLLSSFAFVQAIVYPFAGDLGYDLGANAGGEGKRICGNNSNSGGPITGFLFNGWHFNRSLYYCGLTAPSDDRVCCNNVRAYAPSMSLSLSTVGRVEPLFTNDSIEASGNALVSVCQNGYALTYMQARLYNTSDTLAKANYTLVRGKTGLYSGRGQSSSFSAAMTFPLKLPFDQPYFFQSYKLNATLRGAGNHHSAFIGWTGPESEGEGEFGVTGAGRVSGETDAFESCVLKKLNSNSSTLIPLPSEVLDFLPPGRDEPNITIDTLNFYLRNTTSSLNAFTAEKDETGLWKEGRCCTCDSLALDGRQLATCMYNWDDCIYNPTTYECITCGYGIQYQHYGASTTANVEASPLGVYKRCNATQEWIADTFPPGGITACSRKACDATENYYAGKCVNMSKSCTANDDCGGGTCETYDGGNATSYNKTKQTDACLGGFTSYNENWACAKCSEGMSLNTTTTPPTCEFKRCTRAGCAEGERYMEGFCVNSTQTCSLPGSTTGCSPGYSCETFGGDKSWLCSGGNIYRCKFDLGGHALNNSPLKESTDDFSVKCAPAKNGANQICVSNPGYARIYGGEPITCSESGRWTVGMRIVDVKPATSTYLHGVTSVLLNITVSTKADNCIADIANYSSADKTMEATANVSGGYNAIAANAQKVTLTPAADGVTHSHNFTNLKPGSFYVVRVACMKGSYNMTETKNIAFHVGEQPLIKETYPPSAGLKTVTWPAKINTSTSTSARCSITPPNKTYEEAPTLATLKKRSLNAMTATNNQLTHTATLTSDYLWGEGGKLNVTNPTQAISDWLFTPLYSYVVCGECFDLIAGASQNECADMLGASNQYCYCSAPSLVNFTVLGKYAKMNVSIASFTKPVEGTPKTPLQPGSVKLVMKHDSTGHPAYNASPPYKKLDGVEMGVFNNVFVGGESKPIELELAVIPVPLEAAWYNLTVEVAKNASFPTVCDYGRLKSSCDRYEFQFDASKLPAS